MARPILKSAEQLWKRLETDTGRAVSRVERKHLEEERRVAIALDSAEPDGYDECVAALRKLRRLHKALLGETDARPASPARAKDPEVRLAGIATPNEVRRAEIFARWVARRTLRLKIAQEVRGQLLRDPKRHLAAVGVLRLLLSPATALLSPHFFRDRGIPISGHRAEVLSRAPRITKDLRLEEDIELLIRWKRRELKHSFTLGGRDHPEYLPPVRLRFRGKPPDRFETTAHQDSCLWLLAEAHRQLGVPHGWSFNESAWLLLSGIPADRKPVRVRPRGIWDSEGNPLSAFVTVSAKSFVSGATVARAYEKARKALLKTRPQRPMGAKTVTLFEFVDSRRDPESAKVPWSDLMREWDMKAPPRWRYKDRGHFMRDYLRAKRLLVEDGLPKPVSVVPEDEETSPETWFY